MNAINVQTITTEDTGETIHGVTVLGNYHMNGGYDWMELIGEHGWVVIPSWGSDGWDLGVLTTEVGDAAGWWLTFE
ncbi:hypothetical protein ACLRGI_22620 [Paenarthrobacter nitroguajacolicus]|uniref:hypothetical protein n=1 Tax=Paenarthrobacter nitroguajacolicus TaxID=211146 RepID=UPI003AD8CB23